MHMDAQMLLKDLYNYDNSQFVDWLNQKGFYVARESKANYCQTSLSLASSLNYCFLDHLFPTIPSLRESNRLLTKLIRTSRVSSTLRELGYKAIAFSSGYSPTELKGADFYVAPPWNISEFSDDLIGMLPVHAAYHFFLDKYGLGNDFHRRLVSFSLDNLGNVTKGNGPFFVFCHIVAPHLLSCLTRKANPWSPTAPSLSTMQVISIECLALFKRNIATVTLSNCGLSTIRSWLQSRR